MLLSFLSNCLAFGLSFSFERIKIIKLENMNKIKDLIGCFTVNNLRNFNEARWLDGRHHHHFRHFVKENLSNGWIWFWWSNEAWWWKIGGNQSRWDLCLNHYILLNLTDKTQNAAQTAAIKSKSTKNIPKSFL